MRNRRSALFCTTKSHFRQKIVERNNLHTSPRRSKGDVNRENAKQHGNGTTAHFGCFGCREPQTQSARTVSRNERAGHSHRENVRGITTAGKARKAHLNGAVKGARNSRVRQRKRTSRAYLIFIAIRLLNGFIFVLRGSGGHIITVL